MISLHKRLATFVLLAGVATLPCQAESSFASSVSDSLSRSSGSISDSLHGSSNASSPDNRQVKGDYKVIDVAEVADRPGLVQLRLQPVAMADAPARQEVLLWVPREAAEKGHAGNGAIVTAMQRPYGIEFANGRSHEAFFLALADDWSRETRSTPLAI